MTAPTGIARVILVVLDGLRPDAIATHRLPTLTRLLPRAAHTLVGATVAPSVTVATLASLFTGVCPRTHGLRSERDLRPRLGHRLTLLPRVLARQGYPMFGHMRELPRGFGMVGRLLAGQLGVAATFAGHDAAGILDAARPTLARARRGAIYLHWPDADHAGHAAGWMSPDYAAAAHRLDEAMAQLLAFTGVLDDPATVLIAFADHGGGGAVPCDHDSAHPLDTTIPILIAGGGVHPGPLPAGSSPLDIAATVPWLLGITPPAAWMGRPLTEAFTPSVAARHEVAA